MFLGFQRPVYFRKKFPDPEQHNRVPKQHLVLRKHEPVDNLRQQEVRDLPVEHRGRDLRTDNIEQSHQEQNRGSCGTFDTEPCGSGIS